MNHEQPRELAHRDIRQRELVPPPALAACHALVIGVGAIGRQVALQLAALGLTRMDLIDDDVVSVENLAPQSYWPTDLGCPKVEATAQLCRQILPMIEIDARTERFRRSSSKSIAGFSAAGGRRVVFVCVDSIATRTLIWETVRDVAALVIDGRMSGEVIRVLTAERPATDEHYQTTLFAPERAQAGSCTARSTIYTASIAAGLMLTQFSRWLRHVPADRDLVLNLLSAELSVS